MLSPLYGKGKNFLQEIVKGYFTKEQCDDHQ